MEDTEHKSLAPVLWMSVVVMLVTPFFAPNLLGRVATTAAVGGTAVVALRRSGARRSVRLAGEAIVVGLTLMAAASREFESAPATLEIAGTALLAILLLVTPSVVVFRLAQRPKVTLDTVAGALAAYIQIGLFFATLYRLDGLVESTPFFTGTADPTMMDFQFFSFVTLTTLGYGDLVPATDVGQSMAMFEAVLGQVFLVTVVALAVGNLGEQVRPRGDGAHARAGSDDRGGAPT